MRSIKKIHTAESRPMPGLSTFSPLPTRLLRQIDPFIFLNHHGPEKFPPHNDGLPFGPHPHRGMETLTFILKGDVKHKDSGGHESVIRSGGIQWMTAGRGLLHAETSSEEFLEQGGEVEILQLWINLPRKLKMTEPDYNGLQKDEIPVLNLNGGNLKMNLISGKYENTPGPVTSLTGVFMSSLEFTPKAEQRFSVSKERNIFLYVVRGKLLVNGEVVEKHQLVEFQNDGEDVLLEGMEEGIALFGHAQPYNEPMVAQGPFVMNSTEEIQQAYQDFREGKMGRWE